jgi:hypothetical protein
MVAGVLWNFNCHILVVLLKLKKLNFFLFYQNFPKIPKENGSRGLKPHYKMLKVDFRPSSGRESLWITGKKVGFSKAHCEV